MHFPKDCPCGEAGGNGDEVRGSQNANNVVPTANFQPVLVLIEFMENGDLQSFLKKRRQESFANCEQFLFTFPTDLGMRLRCRFPHRVKF